MLFCELAKYFRNFFQDLLLFLAFVEENQGKSGVIPSFRGLNSEFSEHQPYAVLSSLH